MLDRLPIRVRRPGANAMTSALKPRKQPLQERSGALVDATIEAAIRILIADGYQRLGTTRVAEVAGVSVGSLYQYFPNKQALVAEIVRRRTVEICRAVAGASTVEARSVKEAVDLIMRALLDEKAQHLALSKALSEAMAEVQGRSTTISAARELVGTLVTKLEPFIGRSLDASDHERIGIAVAAVEGALWEAIERRPEALQHDETRRILVALFLAASGFERA